MKRIEHGSSCGRGIVGVVGWRPAQLGRKARSRRRRAARQAEPGVRGTPQPRAAISSSPVRAFAAIRSTSMRRACSSTRRTSRRPASTRSTTCCSAFRAPAAASTPSSTIPATSAIRPTAAASAPVRPRSIFATSSPIRTLVLVDGLRFVNGVVGQRRSRHGRPQLDPRQHDRARRSPAGRRFDHLRLGRDRRRRQHHHQDSTRRALPPRRRSATISIRTTAGPRTTS